MITEIFIFFGNVVLLIQNGLDNAKIEGISMLDIFCAIMFLDITVWFIMRVLKGDEESEGKD